MVLSTDWSQYSLIPQIKGKVHRVKWVIDMAEPGCIMNRQLKFEEDNEDDAQKYKAEKQMLHSWCNFILEFFFLVGAFLVSGIYDLLPILSTYVNEPLKMTEYVPHYS